MKVIVYIYPDLKSLWFFDQESKCYVLTNIKSLSLKDKNVPVYVGADIENCPEFLLSIKKKSVYSFETLLLKSRDIVQLCLSTVSDAE